MAVSVAAADAAIWPDIEACLKVDHNLERLPPSQLEAEQDDLTSSYALDNSDAALFVMTTVSSAVPIQAEMKMSEPHDKY